MIGYQTLTSQDYYNSGQGIGSRVPINVPTLAYTDSSGQIYKVNVFETIINQTEKLSDNMNNKIKY